MDIYVWLAEKSDGTVRSDVDPAVYGYESPVPLFDSGAEAAAHGMRDISAPGETAGKKIEQLEEIVARRKKERKSR